VFESPSVSLTGNMTSIGIASCTVLRSTDFVISIGLDEVTALVLAKYSSSPLRLDRPTAIGGRTMGKVEPPDRWYVRLVVGGGIRPNLIFRKTRQAMQFSMAMLGIANMARYTGGMEGERIIARVKMFPPTVIR